MLMVFGWQFCHIDWEDRHEKLYWREWKFYINTASQTLHQIREYEGKKPFKKISLKEKHSHSKLTKLTKTVEALLHSKMVK